MSRREKKLEKLLDEDLYRRAKKAVASDEFTYNHDVKAYIEFYELMIPSE